MTRCDGNSVYFGYEKANKQMGNTLWHRFSRLFNQLVSWMDGEEVDRTVTLIFSDNHEEKVSVDLVKPFFSERKNRFFPDSLLPSYGYESKFPFIPFTTGSLYRFHIDAKSDHVDIVWQFLQNEFCSKQEQETISKFSEEVQYQFEHLLKQFNLCVKGEQRNEIHRVEPSNNVDSPTGAAADDRVIHFIFDNEKTRVVRYKHFKECFGTSWFGWTPTSNLPQKIVPHGQSGQKFLIDANSDHFDIVLEYFRSSPDPEKRTIPDFMMERVKAFPRRSRDYYEFDNLLTRFNLRIEDFKNLPVKSTDLRRKQVEKDVPSKTIVIVDQANLLDDSFKERLQTECRNDIARAKIEMSREVKPGELCLVVSWLGEDHRKGQAHIFQRYAEDTSKYRSSLLQLLRFVDYSMYLRRILLFL